MCKDSDFFSKEQKNGKKFAIFCLEDGAERLWAIGDEAMGSPTRSKLLEKSYKSYFA